MPSRIAAIASFVERARSVSSIRSRNFPPFRRANSQLNKAVRAPPMCRNPVGEGAKRVTTGRAPLAAASAAVSLPLAIGPGFLFTFVMAASQVPLIPLDDGPADAAVQKVHWRKRARLSSGADAAEAGLARAGFDRGPWLAVAFASGIGAWFL